MDYNAKIRSELSITVFEKFHFSYLWCVSNIEIFFLCFRLLLISFDSLLGPSVRMPLCGQITERFLDILLFRISRQAQNFIIIPKKFSWILFDTRSLKEARRVKIYLLEACFSRFSASWMSRSILAKLLSISCAFFKSSKHSWWLLSCVWSSDRRT